MPLDPKDKTLVLLNAPEREIDLRVALAKQQFTVKKFASTEDVRRNQITVTATGATEDERKYAQAGARYGLTLSQGPNLDHCPWNDNIKANFTLEVSDLMTNDVVLIMKKGNWTGLCGPFSARSTYIFDELAADLAKNWK